MKTARFVTLFVFVILWTNLIMIGLPEGWKDIGFVYAFFGGRIAAQIIWEDLL